MPHRRCRKPLAIFLCGMMCLFLWQASIYPVLGKEENKVIIIQRGETLWSLAQRYNSTVEDVAKLNNVKSPSKIRAGETLLLPSGKTEESKGSNTSIALATQPEPTIQTYDIIVNETTPQTEKPSIQTVSRSLSNSVSEEDVNLLARVIYGEARGEAFLGQVAVGAVVLNRLEDPRFPKTIRAVIYEDGAFTAVDDQQIHLEPDSDAYKAAEEALSGTDPTNGAIFYYNPHTATDNWIKTRTVVKQIGNHNFSI